jgi:hypothetical protein
MLTPFWLLGLGRSSGGRGLGVGLWLGGLCPDLIQVQRADAGDDLVQG